jgi:hypothetical protein
MTHYQVDRFGADLADDAELALITAYTGGSMSDAERDSFEQRLVADEAFYNRVAPFLRFFHSRKLLPSSAATRARIEARRAARRQRGERADHGARIGLVVETGGAQVTHISAPSRRKHITVASFTSLAMAAGTVITLVLVRAPAAVDIPRMVAQVPNAVIDSPPPSTGPAPAQPPRVRVATHHRPPVAQQQMHFGETEADRLLAATVPVDSMLPESRVTPAGVAATQDTHDTTRVVAERPDSTKLTTIEQINGKLNGGSVVAGEGIMDRLKDKLREIRDRLRRPRNNPALPPDR